MSSENKVNNMVTPSIFELSQDGKYNKYELTMAVAKCAKLATDKYQEERANAKNEIDSSKSAGERTSYETVYDKVSPEYRDVRAVRIGVDRLSSGEFVIDDNSVSKK
ncbi:MAG: hypothetical protein KBT31_03020 [Firmicutes bacterium]|nr:hypothetical protein [Candidatus Colimorpha enterica]